MLRVSHGSLLRQMLKQVMTKNVNLINCLISATTSAIIGAVSSLLVNSTLLEISLNRFFSIYFFITFFLLGIIILYGTSQTGTIEIDERRKFLVNVFGYSVKILFFFHKVNLNCDKICLSGLTSLILEKDFFLGSHPMIKLPFYGIMGAAISFSITFTFCDLINYCLANLMN